MSEKLDIFSVAAVNFVLCQGYLTGQQDIEDYKHWPVRRYDIFSSSVSNACEEHYMDFVMAMDANPIANIDWVNLSVTEDTQEFSQDTFDDEVLEGWNLFVDIPDVNGNMWMFAYEVDDGSFGGVVQDLLLYPNDEASLSTSFGLFLLRQDPKYYRDGKQSWEKKWNWTAPEFPELVLKHDNWRGCRGETVQHEQRKIQSAMTSVEARYRANRR